MATYSTTQLYIDTVYISSRSANNNTLHGVSGIHGNINTSNGYAWLVQIYNNTSGNINLSNYELRICTDYINTSDAKVSKDIDIALSGTLNSGNSYYVGHTSIASDLTEGTTISVDKTDTNFLPDQKQSVTYNSTTTDNVIIASSRFRLRYTEDQEDYSTLANVGDTTFTDRVGDVSAFFANGIVFQGHSDLNKANNGTDKKFNYSTIPTTVAASHPNSTFTSSYWITVEDTGTFANTTAYLIGAGAGDPHVTTLSGQHYDFDYNGFMRYFDNNNPNDRFLINVQCEKSKYKRWENNSYYTKVFIKHNEKTMLLDLGFRGIPVKVLENNGFEYSELKLVLDKDAEEHCTICPRWGRKQHNRAVLHERKYDHQVLGAVRNGIGIKIETQQSTYELMFENVNKYNLQPARIFMKIDNVNKILLNRYQGLVVDKKWAPYSILDSINNIDELDTSKETEHEIPIEVTPSHEINPMYY